MRASSKSYPWRFALFLIAYYMTNSVYQGFMTLYYESSGFSSTQIGAIYASFALVSVFAQPFWGIRGDRIQSRNRLLRMLAIYASAFALLFLLTDRFAWTLAFACLFSSVYTSIQPMGDSIILASLNEREQPFGPLRLTGAIMFAVASLAFGAVLNANGRTGLVVVTTSVLCLLIAPTTYALPDTPGFQSKGKRMSFSVLLKNRELMLLMVFILPMQLSMGYFYTFFAPMFISFDGANSTLLGWCYFISTVGEIPYLLLSDKLFDRFGAGKLMCAAGAVLMLRWWILASTSNVTITMLSQLLHGWGFIVVTVAMAKYISRTVPEELQASGQMLLAVVSFGIARVAGNLSGGFLADAFGRQRVFYLMASLCGLTVLGFSAYYFRRAPLNGLK